MKVTVKDGRGKKAYLKAIRDIKSKSLRVGWFSDLFYDTGQSVAYIASIQEFGAPDSKIPARPFMRPTIQEKNNEWRNIARNKAKKVFSGQITYQSFLYILGSRIRGDIIKKIESIQSPPLKQSTINARLSTRNLSSKSKRINMKSLSKPLIDTGYMVSTLTYEISNK